MSVYGAEGIWVCVCVPAYVCVSILLGSSGQSLAIGYDVLYSLPSRAG
jgi:hypothetical protein